MEIDRVADKGLVMLGCGKMGGAMLQGWLARGLPAKSVWVKDPNPSDWLLDAGVHLNSALPEAPALVLIAVKPQVMNVALQSLSQFGNSHTLFVSIAAGITIPTMEAVLGRQSPIVRAMPNTPAAIGRGVTAIIGNEHVGLEQIALAQTLLEAVGEVVRLENEDQMDAVTGLSGSGPGYVFYMIECLAKAGEVQGLPSELAMHLAKATVAGSGALAEFAEESPEQLRLNVTSPNGTTQAGLSVLMDNETGLAPLLLKTVEAATERSKALRNV